MWIWAFFFSFFFLSFELKIQSLSRKNVVLLRLVQAFSSWWSSQCLAGGRILPTMILCIKLYVCVFSGCTKLQRKRKAMGKKGKGSKKKRVEIRQWKMNFYVKQPLMRNQGNDATNSDSLHYLLPQIPVWTGKRSERTPQNQQIKLPVYLMCCWKRAP